MKATLAVLLSALLAAAQVHAADDTKKPAAKKEKKAAAKKPGDSDKNIFQKAESSVGDFANRNKLWTRHSDDKKKKE
jgi:hypothetical protein